MVQAALQEMHDDNIPKELADKTAAYLLFFGLHRRSEILEMQATDVRLNESEDSDMHIFPRKAKREAGGFSRELLGWLKPSFELCASQFLPKTKDDRRFFEKSQH